MSYEEYWRIFWIAAILCAIAFLICVFLFFFLHIRAIMGELTGATARKAIRTIREQNEQAGYKTGAVASPPTKQKTTGPFSASAKLKAKGGTTASGNMAPPRSRKLTRPPLLQSPAYTNAAEDSAAPPPNANRTTLLADVTAPPAEQTTVLADEVTTVLSVNETTVLPQEPAFEESEENPFRVESELMFTQTEDVIE